MEMHVRHDRDAHLRDDLFQGLGVLPLRHRHPDDVRPRGGQLLDFADAAGHVVRVAAGHASNADGRPPADPDPGVRLIPNDNLTGLALRHLYLWGSIKTRRNPRLVGG